MEDKEEEEEASTPFWVQSTTNNRRLSSFFFSSGLVVFILLVTSVFFLVFILPTTLSFTSQIFRPNSVKRSWDSLNIVLVLVAVLFGFVSRIKNEDSNELQSSTPNKQTLKPKPTSDHWFTYNDNNVQKPNLAATWTYNDESSSFLKRNSSSYPDLREFDYDRTGFYDDLNVNTRRVTDPVIKPHHRRHRSVEEIDSLRPANNTLVVNQYMNQSKEDKKVSSNQRVEEIDIPSPANNTLVVNESLNQSMEDKKVSSPPREPANLRHRRYRSVEEIDTWKAIPLVDTLVVNESKEDKRAASSPSLEPANLGHRRYRSVEEIDSLRSIPKTRMFVDTLVVNQGLENRRHPERIVRRKHRDESIREGNGDEIVDMSRAKQEPDIKRRGSATKDFFNSLYHKKKKKKPRQNIDSLVQHQSEEPLTIHQLPLPNFDLPSQNVNLSKKDKRKRTISVTLTPPSPPSNPNAMKVSTTIPPPPPPPPPAFLKNPAWKFVVQGDYVRIDSSPSSDVESDVTPSPATTPLYCPSPDVNTKAETFITSFRAKLKLEKTHSINARQLGLSGLGHAPSRN